MGCGVYWKQIKELDRALGTMRKFGIPELSDAYQILAKNRQSLLGQMGIKIPRTLTQIVRLVGFSPGIIALWHDVEQGWMTEARARPGALPVYKKASDEVAIAIIQRKVSAELEAELMTPDPYLGE